MVPMSDTPQRETGSDLSPRCDLCSNRGRCLFFVLPQPEYTHFRSLIRERSISIGESIEVQGLQRATVGVVKVGLVKCVRRSAGSDGHAIALLGKGRLIGFTQPFAQPALLSLGAITPMRLCEVDTQAIRSIAMQNPLFEQATYRTIAAFVGSVADWSGLMREDSFLFKVCVALQLIAAEEGSQAFRIPSHVELAKLLGVRRETVARQIAILIEKGVFRKVDRWHGVLSVGGCDALAPGRRALAAEDLPRRRAV